MVNRCHHFFLIYALTALVSLCVSRTVVAQQVGSIRGTIFDADFDTPLSGVRVTVAETGVNVTSSDQGAYVITDVEPGDYTLVFIREGYIQEVKSDVVVNTGQLTNVETTRLNNDFQELDEFVVRDLKLDAGSEESLLELRFESPQLLDSIGSDFLSRAGASNAADGLKLISGATTTADGFAAVRGLPPRYVSTQLNGFVLPSADPETRAVQLDLFPSEVIESIQVSKSFTPDQQGAASGGGVNIVTKSIPDENFIKFSASTKYSTQQPSSGEFLRDARGNVPYFGNDRARELADGLAGLQDASGLPPALDPLPVDQFGSPSPTFGSAPIEYSMDLTAGYRHEFDTGVTIGGLITSFWDQDISHDDDRINDDREAIISNLAAGLVPDIEGSDATGFLTTTDPGGEQRLTSIFDETQSKQEITWGGLATLGLESENHRLGVTFMGTRVATSTVTIAEDIRGKEEKFPGHDPNAVSTPGGSDNTAAVDAFGSALPLGDDLRDFAPYRRLELQEYLEKSIQSLQFKGEHTIPIFEKEAGGDLIKFKSPKIDWHYANSRSEREEPGTTIFDTKTFSPRDAGGFVFPEQQLVTFVGSNDVGPFNVVFRDIEERSDQYRLNLVMPFEQWSGESGSIRLGFFDDQTTRTYSQNTFAYLNSSFNLLEPFDGTRLSEAFLDPGSFPLDTSSPPDASGFLTATPGDLVPSAIDFRLDGQQDIQAWYWMVDLPLSEYVKIVGGLRFETTGLSTDLTPDDTSAGGTPILIDAKVLTDNGLAANGTPNSLALLEASGVPVDSNINQEDILPSLGVQIDPTDELTIRGSYTETVARPTFRELTPTSQSLFAGQTPFVGNPSLTMSAVENWDARIDYRPEEGTLFSASYFRKRVDDVIQNIQQTQGAANIIIPVNFPTARIEGWEFEARQDMGQVRESLVGLTIGGNFTLLDTEVDLRQFEITRLTAAGVAETTIDMTEAPEFLANLFLTYDLEETGTRASLFYTIRGDTLIAGPSVGGIGDNIYNPSIYETQYGTLNFTLSQKIGDYVIISFSAKNLTDPDIETVYRSPFIVGGDVVRTRSSRGIDLSLGIGASFDF